MARRIPWRIVLAGLTAASTIGLSLLAISSEAAGDTVVASVTATPSSGVFDGSSVSVSGTAPSSVQSVVLIECDSPQTLNTSYNAGQCDTNPSDEMTLPVDSNAFSGSFTFHDPLATGGDGSVSCDTGCYLIADNPKPGDVSSETMVSGNACNGVFNGNPAGSLVKTTDAGPNNSTVSPGQTITVTLTWNPTDFKGSNPSHTDDCVEIGSTLSATLSQEHKPGPTGGTDTFTYQVPTGGTNGQPVCDRGAVSGQAMSTEKSDVLCYTVLGVATPEVSNAILLPAAGLLVGGGGVLLSRRRRRAIEPSTETSA